MNHCFLRMLCLASLLGSIAAPATQAQWTAPTPEELSMTSQPEVPGAEAIYLNREESTDDHLHTFSVYFRIKVLNEGGKRFANVELNYGASFDAGGFSVDDVQGRTIHSDGTIIPFTGKPYEKLVMKSQGIRVMSKIFTLPDVQVGSILEYRYKLRNDDHWFIAPRWMIQSELFTRRAHFSWYPTDKDLVTNDDRGQLTSYIAWTHILPAGAQIKEQQLPAPNGSPFSGSKYDLEVKNIPPVPHEDYMPPMSSLSYRVLFYYSPYRTRDDFWKSEGKHWAKLRDKFIGPGPAVTAAVRELVAPSDSSDQKLRKLYAAVMKLDNTSFSREHTSSEDKSEGLGELHTTDDIWTRKRGSSGQLTELFVAMARAAGFKAYVGAVTSRDRSIFLTTYLSLDQLDDLIAIVNVDGKEQVFDPGSYHCAFGRLAWKDTMANGIRQTDSGSDFFETPNETYTQSRVQRVADLKLDEHGSLSGTIKITYIGAPALTWRQLAISENTDSIDDELRSSLEQRMLPGVQVKLSSIQQLEDYEQPLVVNFTASGSLGSATGKRVFLPSDIFESNTAAIFPHDKRTLPINFDYASMTQDAMRISFPSSFSIESIPTSEQERFQQFALCNTSIQSTPTSFTTHRDFSLSEILYKVEEYHDLRDFYSKMEDRDKQMVILTTSATAKSPPAGN